MATALRRVRPRPSHIILALVVVALCLLPGSEGWAGTMAAGDRLSSEQRLQSAIDRYRAAAKMPGAALPATLRIGRSLLHRGQPAEVVRVLRQLEEPHASNRDLLLLLAEAQAETGDAAGSLSTLGGLLDRRPDDLEAWCLLLEGASRAGLGAEDAGIQISANIQPSAGIQTSAGTQPGVPPRAVGDARLDQRAAYLWGACLGGQTADGGAAALRRAALGPDRVTAAAAGDLLAAQEGTSDPSARAVASARELLVQGLPGPAIERLRAVRETGSVGAEALALKGYAEIGLGRLDAAADSLQRARTLDPDQSLAGFVQGLMLRKQGDADGAARLFRSIMDKGSANPGVDLEMASALTELGDYAGAEMLLGRAVGTAPADPQLRLAAAHFYVDRQYRVEEGLVHASEAVRLAPASAEALETLGWALHLTGQGRDALDPLRRAVVLEPDSARLRYRLGSVYEGLGEKDRAREEYGMVGELDGVGDQWKRARAALEGLDPSPAR
jgi:Flp pilus assembly protein TadD